MPTALLEVVCRSDMRGRTDLQVVSYAVAIGLVAPLPSMMAASMTAACPALGELDHSAWQVGGRLLDPPMCNQIQRPITITVRINPFYGGQQLAPLKARLQGELRWRVYRQIESFLKKIPSDLLFEVIWLFADSAGSTVCADNGMVIDEYGGANGQLFAEPLPPMPM